MSAYPRNLSYFVKRLANYSRNTYRLQTLNTNTASASQIITVDLPNNALVDLSTLVWYFEGTTTCSGGTTPSCVFPRNIETVIERVEVEVNGQLISPGCASYSHLWQIISDTTMGEDCTNRRAVMQKGLNLTSLAVSTTESATPYTIVNWLGFLGSAQPTVLDTNLLGNVRVRITLSPTAVLITSGSPTSLGFSLNNMFFSVDCISIDDGMYYNLHDQFLSKGGVYEIPFNNFYSFSQAITSAGDGSVKFSLSTQSLNQLWATFAYGNGSAPNTLDTASATTGSTSGIGSSQYFLRSACGITGYQFNINNQYCPNFRPNRDIAFTLLMNSYGLSQDTVGGPNKNLGSLALWRDRYWVAATSLDHAVSADERFISGLNTLGNVAQGFFEYSSAVVTSNFAGASLSQNPTALIFAQTSAVLQVGAGRQIQIIL
jgi:hypothetical protein